MKKPFQSMWTLGTLAVLAAVSLYRKLCASGTGNSNWSYMFVSHGAEQILPATPQPVWDSFHRLRP
jgi:hypothetical protein